MVPRSYLYVPGDAADKLHKAIGRGADALILDLEDSVAPSRKDEARAQVTGWLERNAPAHGNQIWVRINSAEAYLDADLDAVLDVDPYGIVLPKAEAETVADVEGRLRRAAASRDAAASVPVFGLIETARGVTQLEEIVGYPSVARMALGEADLGAELGIDRDEDLAWTPVRSRLIVACAVTGTTPVASTSTDFSDLDELRSSTERLKRHGFLGRTAIHPAQLSVINEVFTPTPDEIEKARRLVERFERAVEQGRGVAVDDDGRMIDEAVARSARRTLELVDGSS